MSADILAVIVGWLEKNETKEPDLTLDLLDRLRRIGICFCTTEYGCVVCGGKKGQGVGRNQFENNEQDEEPKEVPLTLGVGGPVVGTAKVNEDGTVAGEITDPALLKKLQGDLSSFAIGRDPADRYKVGQQTECGCGKYLGCDVCRKYSV